MTTMQEIEQSAERRLRAIGEADPPEGLRCVTGLDLLEDDAEFRHGCGELRRLAAAYYLMAELERNHRERLFHLLGDRRPYVYERNRHRWPDGRFYLVDRGYQPWSGFDMSGDELDALGVTAWHDTKWRISEYKPGTYLVAGSELCGTQDPEGLRLLGALLLRIVRHAEDRKRRRS